MKHPKFGKQYTGAELGVYRRSAVVPSSGENPFIIRLYDNNVNAPLSFGVYGVIIHGRFL